MIEKNINELFGKIQNSKTNFPFFVTWELTYRCQNNCIHCYQMDVNNHCNEVNTDLVIDALNQLKSMGTMRVTFSGGDPFIRKDFIKILEESRHLNILT